MTPIRIIDDEEVKTRLQIDDAIKAAENVFIEYAIEISSISTTIANSAYVYFIKLILCHC